MKQNLNFIVRIIALLSSVLGLVSCGISIDTEEITKIKVGIQTAPSLTKTSILSNGLSAKWEEGDELALWAINSGSSYTLTSQVFKLYGANLGHGFFTSELSSPMPSGTYTYYCTYPVPISVNGTKADFILPSVQNGRVSAGADIMIATPKQDKELAELSNPDDHSNLSLQMNRLMHQLRFWIPTGENTLGEEVKEIIVNMPYNIAGRVTADFTDPSSPLTLSEPLSQVKLDLENPINESDFESADFACAAIFPSGTFTAADYMNVTVYSDTYKSELQPISLSGRTFESGHSTPVRLLPINQQRFFRISYHVGNNFIGEPLSKINISVGDVAVVSYVCSAEGVENEEIVTEFLGDAGEVDYNAVINAVNSGTAVLTYETEHALYSKPLTASDLVQNGNRSKIELGDVPYLLFEDFTNAKASEHNDAYTAGTNSDRNLGGYLLNGDLSRDGWNASRYKITAGDNVRVNVRYQSGAWVVNRMCGRLDTPAMSYLKPGAVVDVVLEFKEAFYVPAGYSYDDSNTNNALFHVGVHKLPENTPIDGVYSDDIKTSATIIYDSPKFASEDISMLKPMTLTIPSVDNTTRIVFFPDTARNTSHIAANCCYFLYLDDIKVYIKH